MFSSKLNLTNRIFQLKKNDCALKANLEKVIVQKGNFYWYGIAVKSNIHKKSIS